MEGHCDDDHDADAGDHFDGDHFDGDHYTDADAGNRFVDASDSFADADV